jgi:hypothetical protein
MIKNKSSLLPLYGNVNKLFTADSYFNESTEKYTKSISENKKLISYKNCQD